MTFDYKQTLELVRGGLVDHQATWKNYLDSEPAWQKTAMELTGPLIILNVVLTLIFSRIVGGWYYYGYGMGFFTALVTGLVMSVAGIVIAAFVLSFLAGTFDGKQSFSRAFAAISLAAIPGFLAGIVAALIPGIGFLIALAGGILSLVFLYKIIPLALDVPEAKRVLHFVVSLIVMFVINMILATVLGFGSMQREFRAHGTPRTKSGVYDDSRTVKNSGVFGEIERQSQLVAAANNDVFEPPEDGKLSEEQVAAYANVMKKTRAAHERYQEKLAALQKEMEGKEEASMADLSTMYSGMSGIISVQNAELEIVKTMGDNWAEHTWVKEQLRVAVLQQGDGSDAIRHNYSLYEEYADDIE